MAATTSTPKTAAPTRPAPEETPRSVGKTIAERDTSPETLSWKDELALLFSPR